MAYAPKPADSPLTSFWRANPHKLDRHRSTERLPATADVVIVGAGFAGTSIVHHLLHKARDSGKKPSILLLDARGVCEGATGRNGGHLKPDPYNRASSVLQTHGRDEADELTRFESRNLAAVEEVVEREGIDCDYVHTSAIDVFFRDEDWAAALVKVESLRKAGIRSAIDLTTSSSIEEAERVSKVKGARGCLWYAAGHLSPYKLVTNLLAKATAQGVNLQTYTPVTAVTKAAPGSDGRWVVSTPRGEVLARTVIHASNGYAAALVPEMKDKIVPVKGLCCRIVPRAPTSWSTNSYMLRHNDWEYDYLISRGDGSVVVGGAKRDFYEQLDSWYDNTDDTTLIEPAKVYFDGYMQRIFKGWEDSGAVVDEIWTGIMGYSNDGCPYVGELPESPGQYICAGFTGHGMPQAFLASEAIASMVVDSKTVEDTGLPMLFRVTSDRLHSSNEHTALAGWKSITQRPKAKL